MVVGSALYTLLGIVVVVIIATAWRLMPLYTATREASLFAQAEREARQQEEEAHEQAEKQRRENERHQTFDAATTTGKTLKTECDTQIQQSLQQFKATHDQLVELIREYAKKGCDAEFQQRFGVTRPPKASIPADDPEVQEYLREHYPQLRDAAVDDYIGQAIAAEAERYALLHQSHDAAEDNETPDDQTEPETTDEPDASREEAKAQVREYYDTDSVRTYLQAAISARFTAQGTPVGDAHWTAYTTFSELGYGELVLSAGAPLAAQDAYRAFAWKKFHLGRRAEKPQRGEYSWPESHELGDSDAGCTIETPVGTFSVSTSEGALPLRELSQCSWSHHMLPHDDMLLAPDERRFLLVNLESLHKGKRLYVRFDTTENFLEDAGTTDYAYCATGKANNFAVGIAVANPAAASPGDAPYQVVERTGTGFVLEMTHDARRHDSDTYPQFVQVDLAWRSLDAPAASETVYHAIS